jgi:multiple sugar transport system permease protein
MGELTLEQRRLTSATHTTTHPTRWTGKLLLYLGFLAITAIFITPILWLLLTSLKTMSEYARYPITILPTVAQWGNYYTAIIEFPFMQYALNSLVIALPSTLLTVLSSALAGFGFARQNAPFKNFFFVLVLAMIMVPRMVTVIPTFVFFSKLGLTNTYWPWILWGLAGSPFHIFLFRQFFSAIPKDLEDAAEVDGCNRFRIFWQIFLPLSGPVLATSAIFHFQWVWGDWFTPNIFLTQDRTTLSVLLSTAYRDPHGNAMETVTMAAIAVYLLPMLLIFLFAQKYIVQGIVTSGIKG